MDTDGNGRKRTTKSLDPKEVARALYAAGGSKTAAAKALGITRPSLYHFLDLYPNIERSLFAEGIKTTRRRR